MYQKPRVQQFGSFRELTKLGCGNNGDPGLGGTGFLDGTIENCFPSRS